jgi:hypothetical protein
MSDDFDWNEFQGSGGGLFASFKEVGDTVVGTITAIRKGQDFNSNVCPELVLRTDEGDELIVTAGQKMLAAALATERPSVGDRIGIKYSGVGEARPGKAPAKLFEVQVGRASTPAPAATPAPAPAAATSLI